MYQKYLTTSEIVPLIMCGLDVQILYDVVNHDINFQMNIRQMLDKYQVILRDRK